MSVVFLVGDANLIRQELQIPYGFFCCEGVHPIHVATLKQGRDAIVELVREGLISGDAATTLDTKMREAGVLENCNAVVEKIKSYSPPDDFRLSFRFEDCGRRDTCIHLPHCMIIERTDDTVIMTFATLTEAFDRLEEEVERNFWHVIDAAAMLAQIAGSAMPVDDDARLALFNALPMPVKRKILRETDTKRTCNYDNR